MLKFLMVILSVGLSAAVALGASGQGGLGSGYDFADNGKIVGEEFLQLYRQSMPKVGELTITSDLLLGVRNNQQLLNKIPETKLFSLGDLEISGKDLKNAGSKFCDLTKTGRIDLLQHFNCYQIKGEDGKGNVHFTGYFTPVLEVRKKPDSNFRYPIYAMPSRKPIPSRRAIDHENALAGQGLELAYSNNLLDNFFLSVQGSGVLDFGNGEQKYVGYAGQNGMAYKSIGKMLVNSGAISAEKISLRQIRQWFVNHPDAMVPTLNKNPSYTFFKWRKDKITGASGAAMSPLHSIAVDRTCIPFGACLLAEVPVLDKDGVLHGHKWQILFANDAGGAIRGPGHVDLYHGHGREAGDQAGDLHHYGRIWLLLAK